MKVVILAGGLGTRISEESHLKPKPMIEIGGKPILWHIMKYYSGFGFHDFIVCCGYKGHIIKEYFADYYLHRSDVTFDFSAENRMTVHSNVAEPWRVTLVDTGLDTQTGARIKRVQKYIGDEPFMLTYGDGVSDVDLNALLAQHRASGKTVTLTGIQPGGRFGVLDLDSAWRSAAFWSAHHWRRWPAREILASTSTPAFGSAWTPSGTETGWRRCGEAAPLPGRAGETNVRFLLWKTRLSHRSHRLQGRMAQRIAPVCRRRGNRLRPLPSLRWDFPGPGP